MPDVQYALVLFGFLNVAKIILVCATQFLYVWEDINNVNKIILMIYIAVL